VRACDHGHPGVGAGGHDSPPATTCLMGRRGGPSCHLGRGLALQGVGGPDAPGRGAGCRPESAVSGVSAMTYEEAGGVADVSQ
jgi:hypothetical protein